MKVKRTLQGVCVSARTCNERESDKEKIERCNDNETEIYTTDRHTFIQTSRYIHTHTKMRQGD